MSFKNKPAHEVIVGEYIEYFNGVEWLWGLITRVNQATEEFLEVFINGVGKITINSHELVLSSDVEPIGVNNRPNIPKWDDYFITMAKTVATRAKCRRRMVGAVLVDDENRVIGTGYNGFPKAGGNNNQDCLTGACPRGLLSNDELKAYSSYDAGPGLCVASHAEVQAIAYRLKDSVGSRIYVTHKPCFSCTKVLYSHGVTTAYWMGLDEEIEKALIEDIFNEYLKGE